MEFSAEEIQKLYAMSKPATPVPANTKAATHVAANTKAATHAAANVKVASTPKPVTLAKSATRVTPSAKDKTLSACEQSIISSNQSPQSCSTSNSKVINWKAIKKAPVAFQPRVLTMQELKTGTVRKRKMGVVEVDRKQDDWQVTVITVY